MLTRREFTVGASCALVAIGEFGTSEAFAAPILTSSTNAVLIDGNNCKNVRNLTVTLEVTQDFVTLGGNGFSLQLNCYPQATDSVNGKPLEWIQYVIAVQSNQVQWGIQYWSAVHVPPGVTGFGFNPPGNYSSFGSVSSNNVVPAGSVMKIALQTGPAGNVRVAGFSVTDPQGNVSSYNFPFPNGALCAIYGFQVDLVGPPSGTHNCTFTSGAGLLTYSVSPSTLTVQQTNTCSSGQIGTGETSNAVYGNVTPASGSTVTQSIPALRLFYATGGTGPVLTRWRGPDGSWSGEQNVGGATPSNIAAIQIPGTAVVQLFYVGKDGSVWTRWRKSNGSWSDQDKLGGSTETYYDITAIVLPGSETVQLFWVGKQTGHVWTRWRKPDGSWSDEQNLGGASGSNITAIRVPGTETVQLFYMAPQGSVRTRWRKSDGSWSDEQNLGGGVIAGSNVTAIAVPGTQTLQLFWVGSDMSVWTRWRESDGAWSDQHKLGGATSTVTATVVPGTEILQLFYVGQDGAVWTRWRKADGSWSDQENLGGTVAGKITATAVPGNQTLQLFYVGKDGRVWTRWRHPNGTWSDQQKLWQGAEGEASVSTIITAAIAP